MNADISFEFAKAYDVNKVDVVKGQKFTINTDFDAVSKWFSDNDPVLDLNVTGNSAEVTAKQTGTSIILIMNEAFQEEKRLTIRVVDEILPVAADLGVTADKPEDK